MFYTVCSILAAGAMAGTIWHLLLIIQKASPKDKRWYHEMFHMFKPVIMATTWSLLIMSVLFAVANTLYALTNIPGWSVNRYSYIKK